MKTAKELVDYCKAQLGRPYWYGTFGQIATKQLLSAKRNQYPSFYKARDFDRQIGQRVHDCAGLVKGFMWSDTPESRPLYNTNGFLDMSADNMFNRCVRKGYTMGTMPDVAGVLVFMKGHVGVYVGNGEVVEAKGHADGVVMTKLKRRPWKRWAYLWCVDYGE